jgi:hypothetical protein
MTRSTQAPASTTVSTISRKSGRLTAKGDHRARVRTRGNKLLLVACSLPPARSAAAAVRRPWARSVPVYTIIRFFPVGAGNSGRKAARTSRMGSGRGRTMLLSQRVADQLLSSLARTSCLVLSPTMDKVKLRPPGNASTRLISLIPKFSNALFIKILHHSNIASCGSGRSELSVALIQPNNGSVLTREITPDFWRID